jgi:hypothetical protein
LLLLVSQFRRSLRAQPCRFHESWRAPFLSWAASGDGQKGGELSSLAARVIYVFLGVFANRMLDKVDKLDL